MRKLLQGWLKIAVVIAGAFVVWPLAATNLADVRSTFQAGEVLSAQALNDLFGLTNDNFAAAKVALDQIDEAIAHISDSKQNRVTGECAVGSSVRAINEDGTVECHVRELADEEVTTANIADGAVTSDKLADGAVTAEKLADDSVGTRALQDNSVSTAKLRNLSVSTDKLQNFSVTALKLAPIQMVSNSATIAPESDGGANVQCPSGSVVISGGGRSSTFFMPIVTSVRNFNGWHVGAHNPTQSSRTLEVFAYCLSG